MGITILIVDDDQKLRRDLRRLLDREQDLSVVGEAGDGADGTSYPCQAFRSFSDSPCSFTPHFGLIIEFGFPQKAICDTVTRVHPNVREIRLVDNAHVFHGNLRRLLHRELEQPIICWTDVSYRLLIAEDHQIVREGFRALLEKHGFQVIGEAADGREATRLAENLQPDVAILDLAMPLLNGLEATREIAQSSPRTKTILVTVHTADQYVLEALQAGARGFVLKSQATADPVLAINEVMRGGLYLSPGISEAVVQAYVG